MLFLFFGHRLVPFGGMITFAVIVQSAWQLLIGHYFDKGRMKSIAAIGAGSMAIIILIRALVRLSMPVVLCIEILSAIARLHLRSVVEIATYNDSHRAEHVIWYWFFTELTRDVGTICGTWTVAWLLQRGTSPQFAILFALPGLLMLWRVLAGVANRRKAVAA